jgi:hypothetical protein
MAWWAIGVAIGIIPTVLLVAWCAGFVQGASHREPQIIRAPRPTLRVLDFTRKVLPNERARLQVQCAGADSCDIVWVLKSGVSKAAGLEPQAVPEDGVVTWSWNVARFTKPGSRPLVVTAYGPSGRTRMERLPPYLGVIAPKKER